MTKEQADGVDFKNTFKCRLQPFRMRFLVFSSLKRIDACLDCICSS